METSEAAKNDAKTHMASNMMVSVSVLQCQCGVGGRETGDAEKPASPCVTGSGYRPA